MNAIRQWRKAAHITQDDLAQKLGISAGSLSRIERGEQWPDRSFFERLYILTDGKVTAADIVGHPEPIRDWEAA